MAEAEAEGPASQCDSKDVVGVAHAAASEGEGALTDAAATLSDPAASGDPVVAASDAQAAVAEAESEAPATTATAAAAAEAMADAPQ